MTVSAKDLDQIPWDIVKKCLDMERRKYFQTTTGTPILETSIIEVLAGHEEGLCSDDIIKEVNNLGYDPLGIQVRDSLKELESRKLIEEVFTGKWPCYVWKINLSRARSEIRQKERAFIDRETR